MSQKNDTILIVEDDENLRVALAVNLEEEGYAVTAVADGASALAAAGQGHFDLVVLDIMLPDTDGYALCKQLRRGNVCFRILMLTARTLEEDLVRGLDAGADDYLVKPYRLRELLARVRALLRRGDAAAADVLACGVFRVDSRAREVTGPDGGAVTLTRTEFDLLIYLLRHEGRAITRDEILADVWGADVIVEDRTVDNFVSSLKKKLGAEPSPGFHIHTVRGVGYRIEQDVSVE